MPPCARDKGGPQRVRPATPAPRGGVQTIGKIEMHAVSQGAGPAACAPLSPCFFSVAAKRRQATSPLSSLELGLLQTSPSDVHSLFSSVENQAARRFLPAERRERTRALLSPRAACSSLRIQRGCRTPRHSHTHTHTQHSVPDHSSTQEQSPIDRGANTQSSGHLPRARTHSTASDEHGCPAAERCTARYRGLENPMIVVAAAAAP